MYPLRPLLPAVRGSRTEAPVERPSKRPKVSSACQACRQRKSKCDGIQPTCHACATHETVCYYPATETRLIRQRYNELRQREAIHEELVELLRDMTERDAAEVVRRLQAGMDVASIVNHVRDGNLLIQLSLAPETRRLYEFPYLSGMPSHLFTANNPYLHSLLYEAALSCQVPRSSQRQLSNVDSLVPLGQHTDRGSRQPAADATQYHSAYLMPHHAARMVEPIVDKITATPWTCVISDNRLLKRLVCSYFYYPHPCGPFVHKDLFLGDMAAGRARFCSPLLVNAMLAIAVQSCYEIPNRSKVWLPDSLTYKLMAEARRLWDLEPSGKPRITTIQVALILSYTTTNNSLDKIGTMYLEQAIGMSKDLDLFGLNDHDKSTKMGKARIFTAWAVFSWQALFDYYFFRPPHLRQPPQVPLPDPRVEPQWYGEIWVQYPPNQTLDPLYLGHKLQAEAILHTIMNEIGLLSFGETPLRPLTLDEIGVLKRKLDAWMATLPEPLQPKRLVFPHHLTLHVQYYQLVIALMKLIPTPGPSDVPTVSNICAGETPPSILHRADLMLETVMRLYYMRHSFDSCDPWIAFALAIIGNTAITNLSTGSSNEPRILDAYLSTLILSAQGLNSQSLHYHLGTLLAIQLQSAMESKDLQRVQTYVTAAGINSHDQGLIAQHSHSQWPLPIIGINEDPEKVRLKNLVKALEDVEIQSRDMSSPEGTPPPG
ncbi:hypothetical protein K491DRAFT_693149 [Lophiostoma macrostomum CBS 122681]|uniref:Zn(2)-C6 fungal-type domain-containing protein n=1 Tax=Lophiostoma macrostomum CBS 122681 TaxID=1314788 RepID=A0A6A6T630_9PLEO|nr:hypothetical protein K491DRAFT_693149 [Lophiostoma macrostomum CBS 122681]